MCPISCGLDGSSESQMKTVSEVPRLIPMSPGCILNPAREAYNDNFNDVKLNVT
jgi:hypothetical protein